MVFFTLQMSRAGFIPRFQTASFQPCNENFFLKRGLVTGEQEMLWAQGNWRPWHYVLKATEPLERASGWQRDTKATNPFQQEQKEWRQPHVERQWTCWCRVPCSCCCIPLQPLPRSEIMWPLNRVHSTWPQIRQARESRASRMACQVLGWDVLSIPLGFEKAFYALDPPLFQYYEDKTALTRERSIKKVINI